MRRTKVSMIYERTKKIRAVQLLLGHRKLENTVRYLGVELQDALALSEEMRRQRSERHLEGRRRGRRPPLMSAVGGGMSPPRQVPPQSRPGLST
jgi:hypothetical protein